MIIDGGLGVELAERGFVFTTRLWSGEAILTRPDLLRDIHGAYLAAGAEVIASATYQLSHETLRELGYDDAAIDDIFARGIGLAREAVAAHRAATAQIAAPQTLAPALVAASLGPYGATRGDGSEYAATQHLAPDALRAFHAERLAAVVRAQPDLIMFETIPTRAEARIVAEAARDAGAERTWIALSCADGERTFGGDRVAEIAPELAGIAGVEVVGVNCTAPPAIAPLLRVLRAASDKPVSICPNLGQHWETDARALAGGATEAEFLRHVPEWLALGATHIGGCCGVGPSTIAALARIVHEARAARPGAVVI
jgi:homocysteine S-methyltransferase